MRYLRATYPKIQRAILVESGPRCVLEQAIPRLRGVLGFGTCFDLVTCYPGQPAGLEDGAFIWRTSDHSTKPDRVRLLREIQATGATVLAIFCSGHPIMTRWKWWLAWSLPMKILVVNENADCYWLDTAHVSNAARMALVRLGLTDGLAGRTVLRLLWFPVGLAFLVIYASVVHVRRSARIAWSRSRERT